MNFKKWMVDIKEQDKIYEGLQKELKGFVDQLDSYEKSILDIKESIKDLIEQKVYYEKLLLEGKEDKEEEIENKVKDFNNLIGEADVLLEEIELRKKSISDIINKDKIKRKDFEKELNKQKIIIGKAIEIQNLGLSFFNVSFLYFIIGILTVIQRNNFFIIQDIINETDDILKGYFFLALIFLIEGNIIYNRSINDAEKLHNKNKKINIWQVIKLPNVFEIGMIIVISVYLFYPNIIVTLLNNEFGILVIIFTNTIFVSALFFQIKIFISLIFSKFNKSIIDPKDRLAILITIMGTIISLIALFK